MRSDRTNLRSGTELCTHRPRATHELNESHPHLNSKRSEQACPGSPASRWWAARIPPEPLHPSAFPGTAGAGAWCFQSPALPETPRVCRETSNSLLGFNTQCPLSQTLLPLQLAKHEEGFDPSCLLGICSFPFVCQPGRDTPVGTGRWTKPLHF